MEITFKPESHRCNECGQFHTSEMLKIELNGIVTFICNDCAKKLRDKLNKLPIGCIF